MIGRTVSLAALAAMMIVIPAGAQQPGPPPRVSQRGGVESWTPPRTPDGQPDIQGFWANQTKRLATYDIEGPADPIHMLMSGNPTDPNSLVIDPPDGKTYGFLEEACLEGERNIQHMLFRLGARP